MMTTVNRLRFFLVFTLISPFTIFNVVQAEQPVVQATAGPSLTPQSAAVSVLDGSPSVIAASANTSDTMLPNTEQGSSLGGGTIGLQRPANNGRTSRQTIRSMDILDRPFRLGHFYGNTVRRRN